MELTEKAAYLKGLADGMKLNTETNEGKLIKELIELTEALCKKVDSLDSDMNDAQLDLEALNDIVDELDEDLGEVESYLNEESEDEDDDEDYDDEDDYEDLNDDECDGDCENCSGCDDEDFYEIVCPACGETVCFDKELDPENLVCPACGEKFGCIVEEEDYKKLTGEEQ